MRFLPHLIFLSVIAGSGTVLAQSSPGPDNTSAQAASAQTAAADAAPSPSAIAPVEPLSLIPPNILPAPASLPKAPTAPELDLLNSYFKSTSLGKAADEHRLHLEMAALETGIRNDEDLHALQATALRASTDLERRRRLEEYYGLYFGKLRGFASTPELKTYIDAQEAAHKLLLLQPRVRHETDEAKATALFKTSRGAATTLPTPVQAKASRDVHP
ncbi:MAG: hypothetical protein ACR2II_00210 [Chthoniobacterales bacterium]